MKKFARFDFAWLWFNGSSLFLCASNSLGRNYIKQIDINYVGSCVIQRRA